MFLACKSLQTVLISTCLGIDIHSSIFRRVLNFSVHVFSDIFLSVDSEQLWQMSHSEV